MLADDYGYSPGEAAEIVHLVKNSVFDPMAAPGTNPETDPEVKRNIGMFPAIAGYVAGRILPSMGGNVDAVRQRVARLGENIRGYWSEHPGKPLDDDTLAGMDRPSDTGRGDRAGKSGYRAIPVTSREELARTLDELGAGDVKWCIRGEEPWNAYSGNGKYRFYILHDGSRPADDPMSIIGSFVTPAGRVANSFDRADHAVKFGEAGDLLSGAGVSIADDNSLGAILQDELYDLADAVDEYEEIAHNVFLVRDNGQEKSNIVVFRDGAYHPVFPGWADSGSFRVIYDGRLPRYATDGKSLYSLEEPYGKCGEVPDGLSIGGEFADGHAPIIPVSRSGRTVNLLDAADGELLLSETNDTPFTDVRSLTGKCWILSCEPRGEKSGSGPARFYVVTRRRQDLSECPCTRIPEGFTLENVSADGRFYSIRKYAATAAEEDRPRRYLMCGGKKVLPEPYRYIDDNGDGNWYIFNSSARGEPYYLLNCDTGRIARKAD